MTIFICEYEKILSTNKIVLLNVEIKILKIYKFLVFLKL